MSTVVRLVIATLIGCVGVWLLAAAVAQRRPSLVKVSMHLRRSAVVSPNERTDRWARVGRRLSRHFHLPADSTADLRLVRRSIDAHLAYLLAAAMAGLVGPSLLLELVQSLGLVSIGIFVPVAAALLGAVVGPLLVHNSMRGTAAEQRRDLRYQLSSYLDVVTMLLAGNVGNEGALRQAAQAGDGRLFVELRRRILVAETSNRSLVSALAQLGDDLDLVELQQVSASASLAASAGAPVAKSLAAKCATLRGALSAEQEADARVRTGKITVPLVGMSVLIMAAVIYPALNFSR
jgi:Flp pilus assembly protein TadB